MLNRVQQDVLNKGGDLEVCSLFLVENDKLGLCVIIEIHRAYVLPQLLLDFSLTVKAATLILLSRCGSANSSAKEGKSGFIYNLVKSK